jgi:hypothetical protein
MKLKSFIAAILILSGQAIQANDSTSSDAASDSAGTTQSNSGQVTSTGSFSQYNLGGGGNNFGQNDIPTYDRIGRVQCAVSTASAKVYGLQRHLSQGALQVGVTIPLTFGRCRSAMDDEVALMRHELHVATVEQEKKDQLFVMKQEQVAFDSHKKAVLFEAQMADICATLHGKVLLANDIVLSQMCALYQPIDKDHGHSDDPIRDGFTKPAQHHHERIALAFSEDIHSSLDAEILAQEEAARAEYFERNRAEEIRLKGTP